MLGKAYRLPFRLLGIPILLDATFLIILPLLAWMIARDLPAYFQWFGLPFSPEEFPPLVRYALGLSAAVGLFVSVLIHELGHSVVGRAYRLRVRNITLWILGGMAQFERMPRARGAEAVIAVAGPITSYLVAGLSWAAAQATPTDFLFLSFWFSYLMYMNFLLATFNLLPALPLDGGRILRSLLALWLPHLRATQFSATISKTLAFLMGLLGVLSLEVFLVLIAFFIYMAVSSEARQVVLTEVLGEIPVRDLMTSPVKTVDPQLTMAQLVHKMLVERHLGYPIVDSAGRVQGLITLDDVQRCRQDWGRYAYAPVASVASGKIPTIRENHSALQAFQRMGRNDFQRLVVLDDFGAVAGIVSKTDLMRALQVRMVEAELGEARNNAHP